MLHAFNGRLNARELLQDRNCFVGMIMLERGLRFGQLTCGIV